MEDLNSSMKEYKDQLVLVNKSIETTKDADERISLVILQSDLNQLIQLTQENLDALKTKDNPKSEPNSKEEQSEAKNNDLDHEYNLFMQEMADSGAYENNELQPDSKDNVENTEDKLENYDIGEDLGNLLGMKCAVYHKHRWGGQPSLHNAMVSSIVPLELEEQFEDIKVRVLFTHPTHADMIPCPFFLGRDCRFDDDNCRYSHGAIVHLSELKEAIEPNFANLRAGSRVLLKLKPQDGQDISFTKKSTEKFHLWHRAVVKSLNAENQTCMVKLEHGIKLGEKRKPVSDEFSVRIEDMFPLDNDNDLESDLSDSLSDTEYPDSKAVRLESATHALLVEKSLEYNAPALGQWERHTRGIGSKLMFAMGYVPGTGLGAEGEGRVQPVEAKVLPAGKSLDHCMAISEKKAAKDPLKVEQRLKKLQKRLEARNKRLYEEEKEREKHDVFKIINYTLGNKSDETIAKTNFNGLTNKELNVEKFKVTENIKKLQQEMSLIKHSLIKLSKESEGYRRIVTKMSEIDKELSGLNQREDSITNEQKKRKEKRNMTKF